jgi:hypothetical protein
MILENLPKQVCTCHATVEDHEDVVQACQSREWLNGILCGVFCASKLVFFDEVASVYGNQARLHAKTAAVYLESRGLSEQVSEADDLAAVNPSSAAAVGETSKKKASALIPPVCIGNALYCSSNMSRCLFLHSEL